MIILFIFRAGPLPNHNNHIYDCIKIQVSYTSNSIPNFDAIEQFKKDLIEYNFCSKVELESNLFNSQILIWDVGSLTLQHINQDRTDRVFNLQIIYVPGHYLPPLSDIAGLAYSQNCFAIFSDHVPDELESAVLLHEFGHILNFIRQSERGIPVNPNRPNHCNNEDCVMFWLITKPNKKFDLQCLNDIDRRYK